MIEIVKGLGANNVLTESFFLEPHFESGAGCWAGWRGWAGLGWAGLGWAGQCEGWAGLGLAGSEIEIGLLEGCVSTENMSFRMANSNKQFLFIFFLRV